MSDSIFTNATSNDGTAADPGSNDGFFGLLALFFVMFCCLYCCKNTAPSDDPGSTDGALSSRSSNEVTPPGLSLEERRQFIHDHLVLRNVIAKHDDDDGKDDNKDDDNKNNNDKKDDQVDDENTSLLKRWSKSERTYASYASALHRILSAHRVQRIEFSEPMQQQQQQQFSSRPPMQLQHAISLPTPIRPQEPQQLSSNNMNEGEEGNVQETKEENNNNDDDNKNNNNNNNNNNQDEEMGTVTPQQDTPNNLDDGTTHNDDGEANTHDHATGTTTTPPTTCTIQHRRKADIIVRTLARTLSRRHSPKKEDEGGGDDQQPLSCDICLLDYEVGETVAWSPHPECVHAFHEECITDWLLRGNPNCPLCRRTYIPWQDQQQQEQS